MKSSIYLSIYICIWENRFIFFIKYFVWYLEWTRACSRKEIVSPIDYNVQQLQVIVRWQYVSPWICRWFIFYFTKYSYSYSYAPVFVIISISSRIQSNCCFLSKKKEIKFCFKYVDRITIVEVIFRDLQFLYYYFKSIRRCLKKRSIVSILRLSHR